MRGQWTGQGPSVVLLHGQPGGASDWDAVRSLLPDHRLLVPDRPGYDGTPPRTWAGNADALAAALAAGGRRRVVVVGHSWGGGVALRLALDHPDLVAGLCLIGSVGSASAITSQDRVLSARGVRHVAGLLACATPVLAPRLAIASSGSRLSASQTAQFRVAARQRLRRDVVSAFAFEQAAMTRDAPRLAADLPSVSVPSLVLTGSQDRTVPPDAARELAERLPRGALQTVPGGHLLPVEHPDVVVAAIRRAVTTAEWS